ncbi:MAG: hypothetical protein PSX37_12335, partial [bacterium]|nr:hypothetical protein [bacterium]
VREVFGDLLEEHGLLLRSSAHREAEWERLYAWRDVQAEQVDGIIRVAGPFGTIACANRDDTGADESLSRMGPFGHSAV